MSRFGHRSVPGRKRELFPVECSPDIVNMLPCFQSAGLEIYHEFHAIPRLFGYRNLICFDFAAKDQALVFIRGQIKLSADKILFAAAVFRADCNPEYRVAINCFDGSERRNTPLFELIRFELALIYCFCIHSKQR